MSPVPPCDAYCDNMGIVKHGSSPWIPLKEGQVQADVLNAIKQYIRDLPCDVKYEYVYGHLDNLLRWDQLTLPHKLYVRMDNLAKCALLAALVNKKFIDGEIPFENVSLFCGGKRASSSPTKSIYSWWWVYNTARKLFHSKMIVHKEHFKRIHWDGMDNI